MSDNQTIEFAINMSPHFKMPDITKRLFNRNFHSDVQFAVDGKIIFAHSLELMKRSVVFEEQFEQTLGNNQIIPITDYKYEDFIEFVRFIYTDECKITKDNGIEILKLATKYKVIMLENKVINSMSYSMEGRLKLFDHCFASKYELIRNSMCSSVLNGLGQHLKSKHFIALCPDTVYEVLKFDQINSSITEAELFNALAKWMTSYCERHELRLAEGRHQFDKLIRKIRFPTMPIDDLRECAKKNPLIIIDNDRSTIAWQIVFGESFSENDVWISKCREEYISPYEWLPFNSDRLFETRISVTQDTIFYGLRIGNCSCSENPIEIEIVGKNNFSLSFILAGSNWWDMAYNLGDSICLKINCEYTITIKYINISESNKLVLNRKEGVDAIINDEEKSVRVHTISSNMLEMFFKSPIYA